VAARAEEIREVENVVAHRARLAVRRRVDCGDEFLVLFDHRRPDHRLVDDVHERWLEHVEFQLLNDRRMRPPATLVISRCSSPSPATSIS
jgi:hypothetical protein